MESDKSNSDGLKVKNRGFSAETFGLLALDDKRPLDLAQVVKESSGEKSSVKQRLAVSLAAKSVASRGGTDDEPDLYRRYSMDLLSPPKMVLQPCKQINDRGLKTRDVFKNVVAPWT